jgi:outer membrane biosynthesis protein TonB
MHRTIFDVRLHCCHCSSIDEFKIKQVQGIDSALRELCAQGKAAVQSAPADPVPLEVGDTKGCILGDKARGVVEAVAAGVGAAPEPGPEPEVQPAPEPAPEPAPQPAPEPAPQPAPQPQPQPQPMAVAKPLGQPPASVAPKPIGS